jgi:hypothetical protein
VARLSHELIRAFATFSRSREAPDPRHMTRRGKLVPLGALATLVGLLVAGNVQYMFVSTYRVKNESGSELVRVHLTLESSGGLQDLGVLAVERDTARTGWMSLRGEGSLQARIQGTSDAHGSCATYVEGRHYHVDVDVDGAGRVHCGVRLVTLTELGLLNVIP